MSPALVRVPPECEIGEVEDILWDAFSRSVAALQHGDPVVLLVDDAALAGDASPASSAVAAGALGLARALASEGANEGWQINVLSTPAGAPSADVDAWVERLGDPQGASGTVVRLGTRHHQRVPL